MCVYAKNLRNPNSVAFYTDKDGMEWLYVALTDSLIRYKYTRGSTEPEGTPQVIATFPTYGQTPAEGGWHLTRTVTFGGDDMYVSVGSSCNSCEEIEEMRATILKMNPDGTNVRIIAKGLRNAVGITFVNGTLYATTNEIDHVGTEKPNDLVRTIKEGTDYGWPYCYEYNKQIYKDVSKTWIKEHNCKDIPLALSELEPHSAPLGIHFFDATFKDPRIQNSFLVATHGSGKPKIGTGYKVQSITEHGKPLTIIDGFLQNGARVGRPVDVLKYDNTSFFVTDDYNGLVYFVKYIPNNI
jgi:glucose/arabinose dehydrogenase